ncbi:MAG: UDP-glucose--hexose-1-phosphate uridylyltransferase [Oscillospiraceae bacterium]|nr:UDP-glucose--hexose-1-phosphate uridylyltransferase [Oscillospiraceae bacterium]
MEQLYEAIAGLVACAGRSGLIADDDRIFAINALLERLRVDEWIEPETLPELPPNQHECLEILTDYAVKNGLCENEVVFRDLFDTGLMSCLTPRPSEVRRSFRERYAQSPQAATDWYYGFARATNYIRTDRIAKNLVWKAATEYGDLDITVNLSKPEKATTSLAAFKAAKKSGYPLCLLCKENEGYAGRFDHPARQNHRPIPIVLDGEDWFVQYSPYVYYNEHCIAFSGKHTPMVIDAHAFRQLLDFVTIFPHYFMGSNADLPIVGGSIFTHAHFQGGHYTFPMEVSPVEEPLTFRGFEDVQAGIVKWPMSVIRLRGADKERLACLADKILRLWRGYTDEAAVIYAETDGIPHNTITPIARRRGADYEFDLVLRNNLTTDEYPLGLYHPHAELHHIKKENIGLIEVMGLAVLPPRLKPELARVRELILSGGDLRADPLTEKHADWAEALKTRYAFTPENAEEILRREVGVVFAKVLEHAGVYKRDEAGKAAFRRFIDCVNQED